ncbi:MAG: cytochrome c oxidase assembly protein [Paracoccus sp. (in: a-proteobacteria)]|uniref:cytochrome c oxidase assembly protein n=1 Tax=Paracoccus sp. TaxID=267 RepID=UPI0026E044DE|nr:cytochrome c oxidase assembly protein [Paracoccus sp. (in: a-proteobacteria)]MDO5630620.1 cytochrome c oxidase assembly protein [Paracoccus sp. (in: a-proteobacteria)]
MPMRVQPTPYCGPAPLPGELWQSWNFDPTLLIALAVFGVLLAWGAQSRVAAAVGWGALVVAFVSPLCALTVALFSARAAHHLLLVTVAAPALALAWPLMRQMPAALSLAVLSAAMVAWNLPRVYDAVWISDVVYWGMQAAMLLPAWVFWSAVLAPNGPAEDMMRRALLTGGLAGIMGLIGAVLTFAPQPLFFQHIEGAALWGVSPLSDQQLAGLVMWVPGFVPVAILTALMLRRVWRQGFAA